MIQYIDGVILAILMGLLFITISLCMKLHRRHLKKICTYRTTATVIDVIPKSGSNGVRYHPVFCYYINGQEIIKEHFVGTSPPAYTKGQQIEILVNPQKTTQYLIVNSKVAKIVELAFNIVGILIIILFLVIKLMMLSII